MIPYVKKQKKENMIVKSESKDLEVPKHRTTQYDRSIKVRFIWEWNKLPVNLSNTGTLKAFKKKVETHCFSLSWWFGKIIFMTSRNLLLIVYAHIWEIYFYIYFVVQIIIYVKHLSLRMFKFAVNDTYHMEENKKKKTWL